MLIPFKPLPSMKKTYLVLLLCFSHTAWGVNSSTVNWGTHFGPSSQLYDFVDSDPSSALLLKALNADGTLGSALDDSGTGNSYTGDLIELGFFDTDATNDSSYTPNESSTDLFKGIWTPLTSKTKIGRDWSGSNDVAAGEFYFSTKFQLDTGNAGNSVNNYSLSNIGNNALDYDYLGDNSNNPNEYENRLNALTSGTKIGIRFHDATAVSSGSSRYNTIMNANWSWGSWAGLDMSLHASGGSVDTNLEFEFDNTYANTVNVSKVGTGDTQITSNDFVTTVTYHDGSTNLDVSSASHVLSGLTGTTSTVIYGGTNGHVVTLNSQSGNTGSDGFDFAGDFYRAASGSDSTDVTIVKSGTGDQILSGNLNLADSTDNASASGGLNIDAGKLILKPASGKTQTVEYLTGTASGTGTLVLDNTGVAANTIVTLGFANNSSSDFNGTVVLDGTGGTSKIAVSSGTTDDDYNNEQTISGVISENGGTKKLVKDGVGRLVLAGDNSFTGGVDIDDGTLVIGNDSNNADAGSGTITINKGKLEVLSGDTVGNTIAGGSGKSMIGGDGTITSVTVGSAAGEIDAISPGEGHSSSTSSAGSTQQVARNDSLADAIGSLTITTLNLNDGGVFDWEIGDFSGSTAGSDWDLLNVGTLNFDPSSSTMTVNILPLIADGSMGATPGGMWSNKTGTSGYKFLDVTTWANAPGSSQTLTSGFDINSSAWLYHKSDPYADWSVYYDTGTSAFYLQYSAVPEPSTYIMVTGLLMVPGMSYVRRFRKRKCNETVEE